jgi:hypothetical protein
MLRIAQLVNLQAFFLQIDAGLWSGDVRRRDMAGSFVGLLVNVSPTQKVASAHRQSLKAVIINAIDEC